jgi:hypothetical protein
MNLQIFPVSTKAIQNLPYFLFWYRKSIERAFGRSWILVPKAYVLLNDETIDITNLLEKLPLETTQYILIWNFFNRFRKKKKKCIALKTSNFYYNIDPWDN